MPNAPVALALAATALLFILIFCYTLKENTNDSNVTYRSIGSRRSQDEQNIFRFAFYYNSHMVLQMAPEEATLWGYGVPGATVMLGIRSDIYTTTVKEPSDEAKRGVWSVKLKPYSSGGPFTLVANHTGENNTVTLVLTDILFGDVWVCSGQSNMEFAMGQILNSSKEIEVSLKYRQVRVFKVGHAYADTEQADLLSVTQQWSLPTQESLGLNKSWSGYSALCFLYGRHLYDTLQHPVGLLQSTWGGTPIEAWSSERVLKTCDVPRQDFTRMAHSPQNNNSVLWNAMLHPLLRTTIKGVIWYQGEANTYYNLNLYNCTFPAMIADWRERWYLSTTGATNRTFPFGFMQLAADRNTPGDSWPQVRWHQTADTGSCPNLKMPNTFMAAGLDLEDDHSPYDPIHPRDKLTMARRLTAAGLNIAYGHEKLPSSGPQVNLILKLGGSIMLVYDRPITVKNTEGFSVKCWNNSSLSDWKDVKITASTETSVTLQTSSVCLVTAVLAYAWKDTPCLYKTCAIYWSTADLQLPATTWMWLVQ